SGLVVNRNGVGDEGDLCDAGETCISGECLLTAALDRQAPSGGEGASPATDAPPSGAGSHMSTSRSTSPRLLPKLMGHPSGLRRRLARHRHTAERRGLQRVDLGLDDPSVRAAVAGPPRPAAADAPVGTRQLRTSVVAGGHLRGAAGAAQGRFRGGSPLVGGKCPVPAAGGDVLATTGDGWESLETRNAIEEAPRSALDPAPEPRYTAPSPSLHAMERTVDVMLRSERFVTDQVLGCQERQRCNRPAELITR